MPAGAGAAPSTTWSATTNPWGLAAEQAHGVGRGAGGGRPSRDHRRRPEYLLFVGCAGAFDDRIKPDHALAGGGACRRRRSPSPCSATPRSSAPATRRGAAGNEFLFQHAGGGRTSTAMNEAKVTQGHRLAAPTASTPSRTSTRRSAASTRWCTTRSCWRTCSRREGSSPSTRWRRSTPTTTAATWDAGMASTRRRARWSRRWPTWEDARHSSSWAARRSTGSAAAAAGRACGWRRRSAPA